MLAIRREIGAYSDRFTRTKRYQSRSDRILRHYTNWPRDRRSRSTADWPDR